MKKFLLNFTALSMSVAISACGMYDHNHDGDRSHCGWDHKEHAQMAEGFFNAIDKNQDGVISHKEYNDYSREWFREADTNHDGKLTLEEVKAQMKREKEKMKSMRHMNQDGTPNGSHMMNDGSMNDNGTYDNTERNGMIPNDENGQYNH